MISLILAVSMVGSSPDAELKSAASFLQNQLDNGICSIEDIPHIRFFTSYSIPKDLNIKLENSEISYREGAEKSLSFVLNSCAKFDGTGDIVRPRRVPGSETLYWIDIRDYGWNPGQFEKISKQDPYFVEPIVDHRVYNFVRLIAGNVIFRTDWFIVHATDVMQQADEGINDLIYYILLYDDKIPVNLEQFQKLWGVDIKKIREILRVERGAILDTGQSGVSRHNRRILGSRIETGYYWETQDSKVLDYVENIFEPQKDAGEVIVTHRNGLQVYMLINGQNQRVDFADNALVIDRSDSQDVRVRTAKSCIICHAEGINPVNDEFTRLLRDGLKVYANKDFELKIKQFYLRGIENQIKADNLIFKESIALCNDLDPFDNTKVFNTLYEWYIKDLDVNQAALEFGLTVDELRERTLETTGGRVAALIQFNKKVPRQYWEQLNAGVYTQVGLLLKKIDISTITPNNISPVSYIQITANTQLKNGNLIIKNCSIGEIFKVIQTNGEWYLVEFNGARGYIYSRHCTPINVTGFKNKNNDTKVTENIDHTNFFKNLFQYGANNASINKKLVIDSAKLQAKNYRYAAQNIGSGALGSGKEALRLVYDENYKTVKSYGNNDLLTFWDSFSDAQADYLYGLAKRNKLNYSEVMNQIADSLESLR